MPIFCRFYPFLKPSSNSLQVRQLRTNRGNGVIWPHFLHLFCFIEILPTYFKLIICINYVPNSNLLQVGQLRANWENGVIWPHVLHLLCFIQILPTYFKLIICIKFMFPKKCLLFCAKIVTLPNNCFQIKGCNVP